MGLGLVDLLVVLVPIGWFRSGWLRVGEFPNELGYAAAPWGQGHSAGKRCGVRRGRVGDFTDRVDLDESPYGSGQEVGVGVRECLGWLDTVL